MASSIDDREALGSRQSVDCFHCGEAIPPDVHLHVRHEGKDQPVCCHGCQAVAGLILDSGLEAFYRYRPEATGRPEETPDGAQGFRPFDDETVQADFVHERADGSRETTLLVDGLYCAACGWLIERSLQDASGIEEIRVNPATGRALLQWRPDTIRLSNIMGHMNRLGYRPQPVLPEAVDAQTTRERRSAMKRLIVAGLGMMQAMMFAVGLYSGQFHGIAEEHEAFLRLVSMLVATPVVLYAGLPIFQGAIRDLRNRRPGMDVPVALAIGSAYLASVWITLGEGPEVYFDSVTMFTFFLLVARYVEMAARHRANATTDALSRLVPSTAIRLNGDGSEAHVPVRQLRVGDRVRIRSGESIPADAEVLTGEARVDESMLTGESRPKRRGVGETVIGGSVNSGQPVEARVLRTGQQGTVAHIGRLLERAQAERPPLTQLADRVARVFVSGVLILAATVFAIWWQIDPARAFPVTLAMLVATCPCALSLATPTALAAATGRLATRGLLIARPDALETLARVTHVVLDKTGTLTQGRLRCVETRIIGEHSEQQCLALAAALESYSEHPLASLFASVEARHQATDVEVQRGSGVEGTVAGQRLRIGRPDWVASLSGARALTSEDAEKAWIGLGDENGVLALFRVDDPARDDARITVEALQAQGLTVEIASGDAPDPVRRLAHEVGITEWRARCLPEDKLARVRELQSRGAVVLMAGDGINDAPVLAGADIAIAVGRGTALAQISAGIIALGDRLNGMVEALTTGRRTLRIIRQNLGLSLAYNATMLPLAAAGLIAPWAAAIGMTVSSVGVVLNARRLT